MTGTDLIIYSVKHGMIGKSNAGHTAIGNVTVDGNFATGEFISEGRPTKIYIHFYKEERVWKIDLTSMFGPSGLAFKQAVQKSKLSENEFIYQVLENISHTKPGNSIWKPVR